ncbi:sulfotransferase [Vibrio sp. FNV 38]|nr:sulfotransferase [Vibrio sp. FNV 38]
MIELTSRNIFCKTSYVIDRIVAQTQQVRPILITGYWRSGTTWVQDVLSAGIGAKTMFEPLEPATLLPIYEGQEIEAASYMPLSFEVMSKQDLHFLDLAFAGVSPKYQKFNYLSRKSLQEAFRHNVVVKLVRGQYISDALRDRYNLSNVIHVSRHPMAVNYSMLRADWQWSIQNINFADLYHREKALTLPKEHQEVFETLLRFNDQAPECKIAATWALSEKYMVKQPYTVPFRYEDLLTNPHIEFAKMAQAVGHNMAESVDFTTPSVVTAQDRTNIDIASRLNSWQSKLDEKTQANIRSVLRELWVDIDQHWEL